MNEEQKNIETCLPENILSEVANVPTDPQFVSLTDEALDPLQQQALQQAGYDGYKEVVMYHQPYTFTSQVKQMKSNLILLLRRLWRFPFGRGNTAASDAGSSASAAGSASASAAAPIRSLADMWQHYITRLQGNPEYGIPSRLDQLTDLPDAPALLADRKISGVPDAEDGMSLAHLLCGAYASVTEINDDNHGWTDYRNNYVATLKSIFPNMTKVVLGVGKIIGNITIANVAGINDLGLPDLTEIDTVSSGAYGYRLFASLGIRKLYIPSMRSFKGRGTNASNDGYIYNMANLEEIEWGTKGVPFVFDMNYGAHNTFICGDGDSLPNLKTLKIYATDFRLIPNGQWRPFINSCNSIKRFVLGTLTNQVGDQFGGSTNLIHLEFGEGTNCNIVFTKKWSPTNALDASRTDLIEEGSTATNNLQQFLSNFKTYIAERLTDKGTFLTLTLSQEVRNSIHAAESTYGIENIIITQKGWTISPAPN